ncbi:PRC-barrel domain-containing protein [Bradyrhizobium sp. WYCCWR 13022]|uniref:PRC-barrel domain-containing protein n=1 Tax=unclassified Bradyrhizobium TaxID=2631580 RepID=UPI00263B12AF|nr:PRC-barrel domain-containing protein [Bradyrhizobium sp. WYCCWR 13022]MDN4986293.1 PRC-barrel domain-containing protein [Bradyrhizobium sp. WYCCWR 13022]
MRVKSRIALAILIGTISSSVLPVAAWSETATPVATEQSAHSPQFSRTVYDGYRASRLLGSAVFSLKGEYLGAVRNMILADDGQIVSFLVEGFRTKDEPEFISRIPFKRVMMPLHEGAIVADFSDLRSRDYGLFVDPSQAQPEPHEFSISKVIGDYARLQAGQGYGYISDLVFDSGGKLAAVVISCEASAGGGTYAFPYPGETGRWSPKLSYYGLPYVTADQASKAGLRLDMKEFQNS